MDTIVIPISRTDYLNRLFTSLNELQCDIENTSLLCYVDGSVTTYQKARDFTHASKFKKRVCLYRRKGIGSVGSIRRRRQRVADIHNELKNYVEGDFLLLLEDDGLIPTNTLQELKNTYKNEKTGLVSGVELGRWGIKVPGVWTVDYVENVGKIESMRIGSGVEEIDAAGLYCSYVKREHYQAHSFHVFDTILGPDVSFGLWLRNNGLTNYVNWNVKVTHMTKKDDIEVENCSKATFIKNNGDWTYEFTR